MRKLIFILNFIGINLFADSSAIYLYFGDNFKFDKVVQSIFKDKIGKEFIHKGNEFVKDDINYELKSFEYISELGGYVGLLPKENPFSIFSVVNEKGEEISRNFYPAILIHPENIELKYQLSGLNVDSQTAFKKVFTNASFDHVYLKISKIKIGIVFDQSGRKQFQNLLVINGGEPIDFFETEIILTNVNLNSTFLVPDKGVNIKLEDLGVENLKPQLNLSWPLDKNNLTITFKNNGYLKIKMSEQTSSNLQRALSTKLTSFASEYIQKGLFAEQILKPAKEQIQGSLSGMVSKIETSTQIPFPSSPRGSIGERIEDYVDQLQELDHNFEEKRFDKDSKLGNIVSGLKFWDNNTKASAKQKLMNFFDSANTEIMNITEASDPKIFDTFLRSYYATKLYFVKVENIDKTIVHNQFELDLITQKIIKSYPAIPEQEFKKYRIRLLAHLVSLMKSIYFENLSKGYISPADILTFMRSQLHYANLIIKNSEENTSLEDGVIALDVYNKIKNELILMDGTNLISYDGMPESSHITVSFNLINKILSEALYKSGCFDKALGDKFKVTSPPILVPRKGTSKFSLLLELERLKKKFYQLKPKIKVELKFRLETIPNGYGIKLVSEGLDEAGELHLSNLVKILNPINWVFTYILSPLSLNSKFVMANPVTETLIDPATKMTTLLTRPIVNHNTKNLTREIPIQILEKLTLKVIDIEIDDRPNIDFSLGF